MTWSYHPMKVGEGVDQSLSNTGSPQRNENRSDPPALRRKSLSRLAWVGLVWQGSDGGYVQKDGITLGNLPMKFVPISHATNHQEGHICIMNLGK